ncbi:modigliani [Musca autumnalis]|uniref:modigliani n=1 Tax=Musca autumnalis TaxID=221902 RepID=UPI003CF7D4FF
MSLNVSILPDIGPVENLPQYCSYHRFLLIEELVLINDYSLLHYGKCRLIGKVLSSGTSDIFLESVKIPNIPEEYALPEGTIKIQLIPAATSPYASTTLEDGKYYEVLGEVILLSNSKSPERELLTSRGLVERMQSPLKPEDQEQLLQYFKNNYKPAVSVWFAFQINDAGELISRNLEVRMLESINIL